MAIVPIMPTETTTDEATASTGRRTFGPHLPSRRTFGNRIPSRRTFGRNLPSRRTFGRYSG